MWSEGVQQKDDDGLENVDKAVISGTQRVSALSLMWIQCHEMRSFGITKVFFMKYHT